MTIKALQLLQQLFAENSNLQLPVGVATEVLEIREWVKQNLTPVPAVDKVSE